MKGRLLYQAVARAAAQNAEQMLSDSRVLDRRGSAGHSSALAILALEEASKAMIYKQAAEGIIRFVKRNPNNITTYSEKDLLIHQFKHGAIARLLLGALELAPFQQTLGSTRKKVFTRDEVEALLRRAHTRQWIQRTELDREGRASHEIRVMFETLGRLDQLKQAALYVGRRGPTVTVPGGNNVTERRRIREIASIAVRSAQELVSHRFTASQRRELVVQLRLVSFQVQRLKRLGAGRRLASSPRSDRPKLSP